jgi:hypothetical protein
MAVERINRNDISAGALNCEQRIRWVSESTVDLRSALDRLDRIHFEEVERSTFGAIRCRRSDDRIVCTAFDRWPALVFSLRETRVDATSATRVWSIASGLMARKAERYGTLSLGVAADPTSSGLAIWARVDDFPSRFLGPARRGVPGLAWSVVNRLYSDYHRTVTFRCLDRVAAELGAR